jgi:hypothetical protein
VRRLTSFPQWVDLVAWSCKTKRTGYERADAKGQTLPGPPDATVESALDGRAEVWFQSAGVFGNRYTIIFYGNPELKIQFGFGHPALACSRPKTWLHFETLVFGPR